ncbi:MAG: gliding motility-associated C-terminal domain-containing protein, partial [Bacteroidetes bacterium]|nr:gliding motility-associated C-terminal domain-containing protein [Bacteroidota bacterium]
MKKIPFIICLLFLGINYSYGTHNRAGEITYTAISQLEYEVVIVIYARSNDSTTADRPQLEIEWGDGGKTTLERNSEVMVEVDVKRSIYIGTHFYPGPGTYTMSVLDPNRNEDVINIPNSVNIPFYIESTVKIHSFLGVNNSPQLLNPPLDHAVKGQLFVHNTGAFDVDGDSLSFKLIPCKGVFGQNIPGYTFPSAHPYSPNNNISINAVTGDLVWDAPQVSGEYNVAILIEEWRHGILVGYVIRDMQIFVEESPNIAPLIDPIPDLCVEAGSLIELMISASDANGDIIKLNALGGPFVIKDSAIFPEMTAAPTVFSKFSWQTTCEHVRKQAYNVFVRAEDNGNPVLVGLET